MKVRDIIVDNGLKIERELFLLANYQKQERKTDLLEFILKLSEKRRYELLKTASCVHNAINEDSPFKMTPLEILMEKGSASGCVCEPQYRHCAAEILDNNSIDKTEFKVAVSKALSEEKAKGNNIMLIGPTNCGKTFILSPLTEIFKCFVSPASSTFAWVGAKKAETIFLTDLRWNERLIPWSDFLSLMEGLPVHLQDPNARYAEDIKKTPIFCYLEQQSKEV